MASSPKSDPALTGERAPMHAAVQHATNDEPAGRQDDEHERHEENRRAARPRFERGAHLEIDDPQGADCDDADKRGEQREGVRPAGSFHGVLPCRPLRTTAISDAAGAP